MLPQGVIQCSLCQGILPDSQGEVFQAHMRDQHRAYCDLDFMFAVFSLNPDDKALILDLMNEQLELRKQNTEPKPTESTGYQDNKKKPTEHEDKDTVVPSHSKFDI